jgi:hypothetical protein
VERSFPPRRIALPIVPNYLLQNAVGVSLSKNTACLAEAAGAAKADN